MNSIQSIPVQKSMVLNIFPKVVNLSQSQFPKTVVLEEGIKYRKQKCITDFPLIRENVGGFFLNENGSNATFNFYPSLFSSNNGWVFNSLKSLYDKMLQTGGNITGFLFGGLVSNQDGLSNNLLNTKSVDLCHSIADTLDKLNIPFGMISGKKQDLKKVNDSLRIHYNKPFLAMEMPVKKPKKMSTEDYLKGIYECVELPPSIGISFVDSFPGI